jgi:sphinganine-1-phosphate aldolase
MTAADKQQLVIKILLSLPSSKLQLAKELGEARSGLRSKLAPTTYPDGIELTSVRKLPEHGRSREWLENEWKGLKALEKGHVEDGKISGTVYHVSGRRSGVASIVFPDTDGPQGGADLSEIINVAMAKFVVTNPLHPDVFPGVRKMESEIVSMCLNLYVFI